MAHNTYGMAHNIMAHNPGGYVPRMTSRLTYRFMSITLKELRLVLPGRYKSRTAVSLDHQLPFRNKNLHTHSKSPNSRFYTTTDSSHIVGRVPSSNDNYSRTYTVTDSSHIVGRVPSSQLLLHALL